jgi:hypothetical protein
MHLFVDEIDPQYKIEHQLTGNRVSMKNVKGDSGLGSLDILNWTSRMTRQAGTITLFALVFFKEIGKVAQYQR